MGAEFKCQSGDSKSKDYLTQRISLSMQRGDAASNIISCLPSEEIGRNFLFMIYHK